MRFILTLSLLGLLGACTQLNYFPSDVRRNQLYEGQTVEDLYENFGLPNRTGRYAYDVVEHVFLKEDILKEDGIRVMSYCDLHVLSRNNYVISWDWSGNNCQFEVADETEFEYINN